jgi:hypothetical protein
LYRKDQDQKKRLTNKGVVDTHDMLNTKEQHILVNAVEKTEN